MTDLWNAQAPETGASDSVSGSLRISDLVTPPKIPPGSGWRKLVYGLTAKRVNPGESPAERHRRELRERIRRHKRNSNSTHGYALYIHTTTLAYVLTLWRIQEAAQSSVHQNYILPVTQ